MTTVSVLVPAFKAEYLAAALGSAVRQTRAAIEILVGDDTAGGDLRAVVEAIGDSRIRYFHHGFGNGVRNCSALWQRASGDYVKWLYDDDILLPESVERLVEALDANPASAMAFHERAFIDGSGTVTEVPEALLPAGQRELMDHATIARRMLLQCRNFIGEPSNLLLRRSMVDPQMMFQYRGLELDFLTDVAMYLNVSRRAPIVAVGGHLSLFRRHPGQNSDASSPRHSAGHYEWELFVRGEAQDGVLSEADLGVARRSLLQLYSACTVRFPEITALSANLQELSKQPVRELFDSVRYQHDLKHARQAVASRIALARTRTVNFCVVCRSPVPGWLPHPELARTDLRFMNDLEVIGSRLDKHLCPNCGCNDRDRHLWLYMAASGVLENAKRMRILHIAPEPMLEPKMHALEPLEYVAGDLFPSKPQHRKINVEALDFPSGHFNLIICNHVLEHVDDPDRALSEFNRCLAVGGRLVAQTPYSAVLMRTMQLSKVCSPQFCTRYYGQNDHVRLFGADLVDSFRAAGFRGEPLFHTTVLGEVDAEATGCNAREPFFLFEKA